MPNQAAENKKSVTVFLPKELVAELDQLATNDDRSRSYIINKLLEQQVAHHEAHQAAEHQSTYNTVSQSKAAKEVAKEKDFLKRRAKKKAAKKGKQA